MASTFYVDFQRPAIGAAWLNDVNAFVYGAPTANGSASIGFSQVGTGAVVRSIQSRLQDSLSIADFMTPAQLQDAKLTVSALDHTSAISAAILACKTFNIPKLALSGLNLRFSSRQTIGFSNLTIDGEGATVTWIGTGLDNLNTGIFQFTGTLSGTVATVSADTLEYTSDVLVSDGTLFDIGDLVQIDSASVATPGLYVNITTKITNIVGNVLSTDVVRRLALTASETVTVTKINAVSKGIVKNIKFIALGQTIRANGMGGLFFQYSSGCSVDSCEFSGFWFKGVKAQFSHNMSVSNLRCNKPAATGGGEGYGVQFEYVYNASANNLTGTALRHLIDLTTSWHVTVSNCIDSNCTSAAYSLHSAYEYDIVFNNCIVQTPAPTTQAFALGSTGTGFADYVDQVSLVNCNVVDGQALCVRFNSKGKGLRLTNCLFQLRPGAVSSAVQIANNDTIIDNCDFSGALEVLATGGVYANDGTVLVQNTRLTAQSSQRSFVIGNGASVLFSNCSVSGLSSNGDNTILTFNGGKFVTQASDVQFIANVSGAVTGQQLYFNGVEFNTEAATGATITFRAANLSFTSCNFRPHTSGVPWNLTGTLLRIVGATGFARFLINGTTTTDFDLVGSKLEGYAGNRVLQILSFTGKCLIDGNRLFATTRTNNCLDFSDAVNTFPALIMTNNEIRGATNIPDAQVTRCCITGNLCDATTLILPTAGASKFVSNNLSY